MYYYYTLFGFTIRSSIEIKQLFSIEEPSSFDVDFIFDEAPSFIHDEMKKPDKNYRFYYTNDYMWFQNLYALYVIFKDGRIYIELAPDVAAIQAAQFLLGYCISMFAYYKDMISIHCGAVTINDKGIIITGSSGAGKSTLTLDLIENGARMISDDVVAVSLKDGIPYMFPAFPQQKICRDAAIKYGFDIDSLVHIDVDKDKFAILRHDCFESTPQKLHSLFVLHKYDPALAEYKELDGKLFIRELEGFDKVSAICSQLFLVAFKECLGLPPKHFEICVEIAKKIRIYDIYRPNTLYTLEEIKEFIYKSIDE